MTKRKYCAAKDCTEPSSPPGTRFCTEHRRAHAEMLQAQLQDAIAQARRAGAR